MKLNKFIAALFFTGITVLFTACINVNVTEDAPTATISIGKDCYKNGSVNVDPETTSYIDITFDKSMDTDYIGFISYNQYSRYDILGYGWLNHFTYRISVKLHYGQTYSFVFNDYTYNKEGYTKSGSYLRDEEGNYLPQTRIEFSTIDSQHPKTFEIDMADFTADFEDNSENSKNTQSCAFYLYKLFGQEVPEKGDTLVFKYKVRASTDVSNVRMQVYDNNEAVNYWKILHGSTPEIVLIDSLKASEDDTTDLWKEGEISIELTSTPTDVFSICLQLYAAYDKTDANASLYSLTFGSLE